MDTIKDSQDMLAKLEEWEKLYAHLPAKVSADMMSLDELKTSALHGFINAIEMMDLDRIRIFTPLVLNDFLGIVDSRTFEKFLALLLERYRSFL